LSTNRRAAGFQAVQHRGQFGHAAAQAHLHGHAHELGVAAVVGQRRAVADGAAAVARAGHRHRILQLRAQRSGGSFGGGFAQEARPLLQCLAGGAQALFDLRLLLQLCLHARSRSRRAATSASIARSGWVNHGCTSSR
jgi:hypothetical protein